MDDPTPTSLTQRILAKQPDAKAQAILVAGFECFLQFGVKRTAMQDIADRAGMSRAALYLHFKNKDDIFTALMRGYFEAAAEAVEETLARFDDPVDALAAAFEAQAGDASARMMDSPHAEELLSAKLSGVRAIVRAGESRLIAVYAKWLRDGVAGDRLAQNGVGPDPELTAAAMLASVMGLKSAGMDGAAYANARARLAVLFGRALRV